MKQHNARAEFLKRLATAPTAPAFKPTNKGPFYTMALMGKAAKPVQPLQKTDDRHTR